MDFYIFTTDVDLVEYHDDFMRTLLFFTQPEIVGEPYSKKGKHSIRFAVRTNGLYNRSTADFVKVAGAPFTEAGSQLTKAETI